MTRRAYLGLGVLVLLIIVVSVYYLVGNLSVEHVDTRLPPLGENFATGHWNGDKWHRTVPPDPATLMHEGKAMTLRELLSAAYGKSWDEKVAILNRIIAEAPYSQSACYARYTLVTHDENGERIWNRAVRFERLQPLFNYHPDSPWLLIYLLVFGIDIDPEAAIHYGTEALKYLDRYGDIDPEAAIHYGTSVGFGSDSDYTVMIHYYLGEAYHRVGDSNSAVSHYKQSFELFRTYPNRTPPGLDPVQTQSIIDAIHSGNPIPVLRAPEASSVGPVVSE